MQLLLIQAALILGMMFLVWLVSLIRRDTSIVDPFWGMGFVVVAWVTFVLVGGSGRSWLLTVLTTIWGMRLAIYLGWRNLGEGEDRRYREMREYFGPSFRWTSLFIVFWLQGAIMWLVSWPIQIGQVAGSEEATAWPLGLGWTDGAGVLLWTIGFIFEAGGDYQLARFKANPANRGQVLDSGLWSLTRHPNYFGDFCIWWGLYLIATAGGAWWTFPGPLVMSIFLMRFSGVGMLEKHLDKRPAYREYMQRTSAFFPIPPRLRALMFRSRET